MWFSSPFYDVSMCSLSDSGRTLKRPFQRTEENVRLPDRGKDLVMNCLFISRENGDEKMTGGPMAAEDVIIDTDELEKYFHALTSQIGPFPSHLENGLSIGVEVFTLSEGLGISTSSLSVLLQ